MATAHRLQPGEWRLDETQSGWRLSYRSQVTMHEILAQERVGWFRFVVGLVFARLYPEASYLLGLYFSGNREHSVEMHDGLLESQEGQFHAHLLDSAGITADGALPGRWIVAFEGHAVKTAELVGWPGFDEATAAAMLRAVGEQQVVGVSRGA